MKALFGFIFSIMQIITSGIDVELVIRVIAFVIVATFGLKILIVYRMRSTFLK